MDHIENDVPNIFDLKLGPRTSVDNQGNAMITAAKKKLQFEKRKLF